MAVRPEVDRVYFCILSTPSGKPATPQEGNFKGTGDCKVAPTSTKKVYNLQTQSPLKLHQPPPRANSSVYFFLVNLSIVFLLYI